MGYKEYQAKTLDEAITAASIDLGVPSSELYYEVTEKGSSGILGFGKKDVTIKAIKLEEKEKEEKVAKKPEEIEETAQTETNVSESNIDEQGREKSDVNVPVITEAAESFLKEVFGAMGLEVNSEISFSGKDNSLSIDLSGEHMGIIIGKRGQTLDSLQYLVNLVVNKKSDSYIRIKLDTEDYRRRRKETLENLAKNIAHKVKRTGKPVTLEAMNPYERRTIHYALQKDRYVTTYSEGEEPYRHVVVTVRK